MKQVILAGAGQIGSRHLQGLLTSKEDLEIGVIDPSAENSSVAAERVKQVTSSGIKKVTFWKSPGEISFRTADLAIISTNSDIRAEVVKSVSSAVQVKHFILEKVVYRSDEEFKQQSLLFSESGSKVWVNCPRRLYPFYSELKKAIATDEEITLSVSGSNWGLGCNAVHFIDLYSFLSGELPSENFTAMLDPGLLESKRKGFSEFTGDISYTGKRGRLMLRSLRFEGVPVLIDICLPSRRFVISEPTGTVIEYSAGNKFRPAVREVAFPFQSTLTGTVADTIFGTGNCELADLNESALQHSLLFRSLDNHLIKELGYIPDKYPIT